MARIELAAGAHAHADRRALVQGARERLDALGDRSDLEWPAGADVWRDGHVAHALGGEPAGIGDRSRLVGGAVVHPREQVEVQIQI